MNIKILDSWLREFLKTDAKPTDLARALSLTSVSIERIEDVAGDKLYDIEVTTNRPDLMSVSGIAREASAVLPEFGFKAEYLPPKLTKPKDGSLARIEIKNDPKLVNRVLAIVMEVEIKPAPEKIKSRLENSDIRSLNNVIDVTNYVMRTIGHPTHVFDYDRLNTKSLLIRESKKGERIVTLDNKELELAGGDIVAQDDKGRVVDLLGVMGLANSVVTNETKRILFFVNNNDPLKMRATSMGLLLRSEAVKLNEKLLDPELAYDAFLYGIDLFQNIANGKIISPLYDIYPAKTKSNNITLSLQRLNSMIGVEIDKQKAKKILTSLGFEVIEKNDSLLTTPPSYRTDIAIEEDLIEEIARVYGYHNLPSILPSEEKLKPYTVDEFFWENRVKDAFKYWGFTEVYTYSMVSLKQYEEDPKEAIAIRNPLTEDHVFMRNSLVPSLLEVKRENKSAEKIKIFEIANVYSKDKANLPQQTLKLAGLVGGKTVSFFEIKGVLEQLALDLGITSLRFSKLKTGGGGASLSLGKAHLGEIEVLDEGLMDFELGFETLVKHATLKKTYTQLQKYPPILEDITIEVKEDIETGEIIELIKSQSSLVSNVSLKDKYQNNRTFHIVYQDQNKNLSNDEVGEVREKIVTSLKEKFDAKIK